MPNFFNLRVVIPCFNEEKGISNCEYSNFLEKNPEVFICFVNDASSDNTLILLNTLKSKYVNQIHIISSIKNMGKADAVKIGINYCNKTYQHRFIGFLDADLATTLEEFTEFQNVLIKDVVFAFGSRISKIGSTIERDNSRFLIGRLVATFISNILGIKVYDTQCGAKLFTKEISEQLFEKKFISRWLFDVEIFYRMIIIFGRKNSIKKMIEIPLKLWIEKGNSKVKISYGFKIWIDLCKIKRMYRNIEMQISHKII